MVSENKIQELKEAHRIKLVRYGDAIRAHIEKYGNDASDWLIQAQRMESYHRGSYNTLIELERDN